MMEAEIFKIMAQYGALGVLVVLVGYFYRKDFLQERESRKTEQQHAVDVITRNAVAGEKLSASINTLARTLDDSDSKRARRFEEMLKKGD